MKSVALLLMAGMILRHNSANVLAPVFGTHPGWVFYVLGGLWEIVLAFVIALFAVKEAPSKWKTLIYAVCAAFAIEGLLMFACAPFASSGPLCTNATGIPIEATTSTLYLVVFFWILVKKNDAKNT